MPRRNYKGSNTVRDALGIIASLDNGTSINRRNVRETCDYCDEHGARIVCLSTWRTIHADITESRIMNAVNHRGSYVRTPEPHMLGVAGRLDLLVSA